MATNTTVTFRLDRTLKQEADQVLNDMGMNMTTALTIFVRTMVRQARIPFAVEADPFYCEANQERLRESIRQLDEGKVVVKTLDELRAME